MDHNPYQAPGADIDTSPDGGATYQPALFALKGRIGRLRYLAYLLAAGGMMFAVSMAVLVVFGVASIASKVQDGSALVAWLPSLTSLLMVAMYAVLAVRRFNDTGRTGWLALLLFVPLLNIAVALYLIFAPGTQGSNRYGLPQGPDSTAIKVAGWATPVLMLAAVAFTLLVPMFMLAGFTGAPGR